MERLTQKYNLSNHAGYSKFILEKHNYDREKARIDVMNKLAEYEVLEEAQQLIKLPCNLDSKVFRIVPCRTTCGDIIIGEFTYDIVEFKASMYDDIGKTIFLSPYEAEAALSELNKKGE